MYVSSRPYMYFEQAVVKLKEMFRILAQSASHRGLLWITAIKFNTFPGLHTAGQQCLVGLRVYMYSVPQVMSAFHQIDVILSFFVGDIVTD